ncbi:MAG: class I SAM-dependent methyltransferase [Bacteroidota bacterium]
MQFEVNSDYGYYELVPKPSPSDLEDYYAEKYYQDEHATYAREYDDEELAYFKNKIAQKHQVIQSSLEGKDKKMRLLDIGCGEGFTMDFYYSLGWEVLGLDFSDFGLAQNHPHLKESLRKGDIFAEIAGLVGAGAVYDVVWLDNVLEHVIDPVELLSQCHQLTSSGGILMVEVPNDFSQLQDFLLSTGRVEKPYWQAVPDHLSYFSFPSLRKLAEATGWSTLRMLADFPIEWFLANEHSNYSRNKRVGKGAHRARVSIENFLASNDSIDMESLLTFYEAMGAIGQGRQIIAFFQKK